jgi:hypothetical protein
MRYVLIGKLASYVAACVAFVVPGLLIVGALTDLRSIAYAWALRLSAGSLLFWCLAFLSLSGEYIGRRTGMVSLPAWALVPFVLLAETGVALLAAVASPVRYLGLLLVLVGVWPAVRTLARLLRP